MTHDFDLFVIGGGSGGVRAARLAAETGAKVALAEEYRMGGTCVIRGCVPKKLMVYASEFSETLNDAKGYGWDAPTATFDWAKFLPAKDAEIARLESIYQTNLEKAGVTVFKSRARLGNPHEIHLNTQTVTADKILIATGGRPFVPNIKGASHAITSNDIFHLPTLPKSILIVGGGYIACEFACILNGLGVKTTQFYRGEQILRGFDNEVRNHIASEMRNKNIDLRTNTDIDGITETLRVNGEQFGAVMLATGRVPNTENMGLEDAQITLKKGAIVVDDYAQTSRKGVYAIGDVTDRVNLTPVAIREAVAFVDTAFHATPRTMDYADIATAVFTQPEIGTVGLTEETASARESVEVYVSHFRPMKHILAGRDEKMLMKMIVSVATGKVLGVHIVGHAAGEMIQLAAIAVKMGATKADFDAVVAVHPTAAEELVTMRAPTRVCDKGG